MKDLNKPVQINITAGTILKSILIVILIWALFALRDLVLVLLTSVVIASAVEPMTRWFIKRRIPRILSVLLIYLLVVVILSGIFYFFLPPLVSDFNQVVDSIPVYIETLTSSAGQISDVPALQGFVDKISISLNSGELISQLSGKVPGATVSFFTTASAIFGGILSFILIIVLSFYLAVQEDGVTNFLKIVIPIQYEKYIVDLWKRSQRKIGLWMQGQLVLGLLIGVLTYLGLSIMGINNALFLALIAAMFELIPIFGPILAAVPAVAFAAIQGGPSLALIIVGLYVIIQQFESQLIHPLVVKKMVGIPAILAIIALIIGAKFAGFLGIILSVPVAAAVMEYVNDIERKKVADLKNE